MSTFKYNFPTTIFFGPGVRAQVAEHMKAQGKTRALVVTDRGLAGLPIFTEFMGSLQIGGLKVRAFSEIFGNPVKTQVIAGVAAYVAHQADSIIGFGGGAALDVAKAIALMVNHPGDLFDYEDDLPGGRPVNRDIPYWVALPTTAGTGSEVGRSSVISDDLTHLKKIIFSVAVRGKSIGKIKFPCC